MVTEGINVKSAANTIGVCIESKRPDPGDGRVGKDGTEVEVIIPGLQAEKNGKGARFSLNGRQARVLLNALNRHFNG